MLLKLETPKLLTSKSLPTNNFLATAAPPSMVTEPPEVALDASLVLLKLAAPSTSKVPFVIVFPLSVSTVNLSTFPSVCILKNLLFALIVTSSWNVAEPSTFRVLFNSVCSSTVSVSSNWTSPVACKVPFISTW